MSTQEQIKKIQSDIDRMENALAVPSITEDAAKPIRGSLTKAKNKLAELLQKKTEEPTPKPVQAERKQDPQPEPKPEKQDLPRKEEYLELTDGVRGGKTEQAREWFESNSVKPAPKPTPKAPAKVHREFFPGLFIEEPATLGELEVSTGDPTNATTLDIPMVNGTILTATYGIAKARARQYFVNVMATEDFTEKRYAAVLKSAMFKNLVRLVMGWGVLKSLDKNNPDYPTLIDIFKIQRQTRPDRVEQAGVLYQMVLEKVESEDKK